MAIHRNRLRAWLAIGLATIAQPSNAGEGSTGTATATLKDVQTACSAMYSDKCRPYLIVAETVMDVLISQANPETADGDVTLVFRKGEVQHCSWHWLHAELTAFSLLHTTLGLVPKEGPEKINWLDALMRGAQTLCQNSRSETPP